MTERTHTRRFLVGLAAALVAPAGLASPALAADAPPAAPDAAAAPAAVPAQVPPSASDADGRTITLVTPRSGNAPAAAASTITCTLQVQNPHNSSHVNGTVNVVTTVTCTAAVPQINIRAGLYKNGKLVKDSGQKTFRNTRKAQANAAVKCSNGTYQGFGSTGILFPPGYQPPTRSGSAYGNAVRITC